jgi:hypothetical protein
LSQSLSRAARKAQDRPTDRQPDPWLTGSFSFNSGQNVATTPSADTHAAPSVRWFTPKSAEPSWGTPWGTPWGADARTDDRVTDSALPVSFDGTSANTHEPPQLQDAGGDTSSPTISKGGAANLWTGANPARVTIDGRDYHLNFSYIGLQASDPSNPCVIDPAFEVARGPGLAQPPGWFEPYKQLSPEERCGYIEWMDGGRAMADAPTRYRLFFLSTLEHAIVRDRRVDDAGAVIAELERLIALAPKDQGFVKAAKNLIMACHWLNPSYVPPMISPSAAANYQDEIPFKVRHFLGHTLRDSRNLEAGDALLLYLQQPGTWLASATAQHFRELHSIWCHRHPYHEAGTFEIPCETRRLTLDYQPICGAFDASLSSDLPDVADVVLPASFRALFEQCLEDIAPLAGQPVGGASIILPIFDPGRVVKSTLMDVRPGGRELLCARLSGPGSFDVRVSDLLDDFFDGTAPNPKHLLMAGLVRQVTEMLDEAGFGYEPDQRFELPPLLRPDRRITLFRAEPLPFQPPSDAYLLAQAAIILSTLALSWLPTLAGLPLDRIEARMPFRHRFSDREFRRLEATRLAIDAVDNGRKFLEGWTRVLSRRERLGDLRVAFGIAFRGQRKNIELNKFARAVVNVCPMRINERDLLEAASASAVKANQLSMTTPQIYSVHGLDRAAEPIAAVREDEAVGISLPTTLTDARVAALEGLKPRDAEILLAVLDRPRSAREFTEFARAREVSAAGAADRINDWARARLGSEVLDYGELVAIVDTAIEPLAKLIAAE